jgi:hypothetical protein
VQNFTPQQATGVVLSHAHIDGKPLLERKEDFVRDFPVSLIGEQLNGTLPPHSVAFVTVKKKE